MPLLYYHQPGLNFHLLSLSFVWMTAIASQAALLTYTQATPLHSPCNSQCHL